MIYKFDGKEYDTRDFEKMSDKQLDNLRLDAESFARDTDLLIAEKKMEYVDHGRDPAFGLPPPVYKAKKLEMAYAMALSAAIKAYIPPAR